MLLLYGIDNRQFGNKSFTFTQELESITWYKLLYLWFLGKLDRYLLLYLLRVSLLVKLFSYVYTSKPTLLS